MHVLLVKQNTMLSSKRFPKGQVNVYVLVQLHTYMCNPEQKGVYITYTKKLQSDIGLFSTIFVSCLSKHQVE